MSRVVIEDLDGFAPCRSLRGVDLAQIQNVPLYDTAAGNTLVLDDAPIVVRLAVPGLSRGRLFFRWAFRRNMIART